MNYHLKFKKALCFKVSHAFCELLKGNHCNLNIKKTFVIFVVKKMK